jgi:hypothetical protein
VGSIVVKLLLMLLVGQVAEDRCGLFAAAWVQLGVVELEGGGGCAPD